MRRPPHSRWGPVLLALVMLAGCARGPDEAELRQEIQQKLTEQVKDGLLEIESLRRKGSSPRSSADGGGLVVYYTAILRFQTDYDFGGWDKLSPASVAYVLGAKEKGLVGLKTRNRAGDALHVHGTSTYQWSGNAWTPAAATPRGVTAIPNLESIAPPSRSKQLIDRLAAMVDLPPPGIDSKQEAVISEELDRATENIRRRLARSQHVYTVATGPRGGEYARFGAAFVDTARQRRPGVAIRILETEGSVQNARLLARAATDYAIIQADVAANAVAGRAPFERDGALVGLRALGSLFPEAVHVVVRSASPIRSVQELRGKRVDIGAPGSGTRHSAVAILAASGLTPDALREARADGYETATQRLRDGQLDAVFVTISAPARHLQNLAARGTIRLLSLDRGRLERLVAETPGLMSITLPAHTYPGQVEPVLTAATVALLVGTSETPEAEVEKVVNLIFGESERAAASSAEAAKVSKDTALRGITIPLHPGASRLFAVTRP